MLHTVRKVSYHIYFFSKDEEESEEGYETIPASEQRIQRFDPGYESVAEKKDSDFGYETVLQNPRKDPGYATVKDPTEPNHGYENLVNKNEEKVASSSLTTSSEVNLVHMSVRKTQSDPHQPSGGPPGGTGSTGSTQTPPLMPRNNSSVVVIEHTTKMAVNNNIGEVENPNPGDHSETSGKVQSHIYV